MISDCDCLFDASRPVRNAWKIEKLGLHVCSGLLAICSVHTCWEFFWPFKSVLSAVNGPQRRGYWDPDSANFGVLLLRHTFCAGWRKNRCAVAWWKCPQRQICSSHVFDTSNRTTRWTFMDKFCVPSLYTNRWTCRVTSLLGCHTIYAPGPLNENQGCLKSSTPPPSRDSKGAPLSFWGGGGAELLRPCIYKELFSAIGPIGEESHMF